MAAEMMKGQSFQMRFAAFTLAIVAFLTCVSASVAAGIQGKQLAPGAASTNLGYPPLNPANNLSDVANQVVARQNILGAYDPPNHCVSVFSFMNATQIADVKAGTLGQDVTTPLQNFLASIQTGGRYCFEPGLYKFTATNALACPTGVQAFSLTGPSRYAAQLVYSGVATTGNLFKCGNDSAVPNLFATPASPATQSIAVTSGQTYTIIFYGSGSITLSGVGTSGTLTSHAYGSGQPTVSTFTPNANGNVTLTLSGTITLPYVFAGQLGGLNMPGVTIGGFMVRPATQMTGGDAYYLPRLMNARVFDVQCGGDTYITDAWDCLYLDGAHTVHVSDSELIGQNDGWVLRGGTVSSNTDVWSDHNTIDGSTRGIHITGGFGGFEAEHTNVLGNLQRNMLVDDSNEGAVGFDCSYAGFVHGCPYSYGNREIMLGSAFVCDGVDTTLNCIELNDPHASGGSLISHGFIGSSLYDGSTAHSGTNILITAWPGVVDITAGRIFNAYANGHGCGSAGSGIADGVFINDVSAKLIIGNGAVVDDNGCWAVDALSAYSSSQIKPAMYGNGANLSSNISLPTSSPTIGCTSGSGLVAGATNTMHVDFNGKLYHVSGKFTLSNAGSGCSQLTVNLPFVARDNQPVTAVDGSTITALSGSVRANSSSLFISSIGGGYPGNTSDEFDYVGDIEAASN